MICSLLVSRGGEGIKWLPFRGGDMLGSADVFSLGDTVGSGGTIGLGGANVSRWEVQ